MNLNIFGMIVAPFTPMKDDGSLNLEIIPEYINYLKSQCNDNLFVLGTTGEGLNLTVSERKQVAEEWMKHGRDKFDKIIIQVGSTNLFESRDLASHAEKIKADAIAVLPPTYYKARTVAILGDYLKEVADTVPNMPVLYYHLPEFTNAHFSMVKLLDNVAERIPNFAGMKYVTKDLADFGRCVHKYGNRFALMYGKDEQILFGALLGGTAFVGSSFNLMGKIHKRMLNLCKANDAMAASKEQMRVQLITGAIQRDGYSGGILKELTTRISGINLGPSRNPPIEMAPNETMDEIMSELKRIGFFQWNQ